MFAYSETQWVHGMFDISTASPLVNSSTPQRQSGIPQSYQNSLAENKAGYSTPPKINIEPENDGLEDDFPFELGDFQVPC